MRKHLYSNLNPEHVLLIIILTFAFFLRVYALGNAPFWIDEATSSMASKMILEKGVPRFDSGLLYSRAYFFHYSQAFFLIFGQSEFFARLPSVIFGMLCVLLAYFIGKEYSKTGGVVSALFMSVFYLEVFFSRQARFYQLFQLMFFLSLYLLYKSKEKPGYLAFALVAFFIALDTQIAGLVLAPFFILHILAYNKKWIRLLAIIPGVPFFRKLVPAASLSSDSAESAVNYAGQYLAFASRIRYVLLFFAFGAAWGFIKKKRLTALMILPSAALLACVFSLETFALRYSYFAVFPLVLYSSLLVSFLYERFGKFILVTMFWLLVFPSNLIFPHTGVNILVPVEYNYHDYSAPEIDLKKLPENVRLELLDENSALITYFSSSAEWYLRKPDYVLPFTMDGRGNDQVSYNASDGRVVDRYSGSVMLQGQMPGRPYNLIADSYSVSKLKPYQMEYLGNLTQDCSITYSSREVKVYKCV